MKKISNEIRAANIFLSMSFIFIYFIFNYYFSYQIRYEQKNAIRNLQHFVKNEIKSFEKENKGKKTEIKKLVEDIYIDQDGNSDYSINFLYEGRVVAQNEKMVRRFDTVNDKVVRDDNGFRRDAKPQNNDRGFRNDNDRSSNNGFRGGNDNSSKSFGRQDSEQQRNNGFRNDAPRKNEEMSRGNSDSRSNSGGFRSGDNNRSFGKSNGNSDRGNSNGQRGNNGGGRGFR